jgi:hypothetical protein
LKQKNLVRRNFSHSSFPHGHFCEGGSPYFLPGWCTIFVHYKRQRNFYTAVLWSLQLVWCNLTTERCGF